MIKAVISLSQMNESYDHTKVEPKISGMWEDRANFSPRVKIGVRPFSTFLTPPNTSGPMHIGNALMIAIQDIMVRYYRAQGRPALWIPSFDHGGYETQILFEKELEKSSKNKSDYRSSDLFKEIEEFSNKNQKIISNQIRSMGASVDWTRARSTLDKDSVSATANTFYKMVEDNLIYRHPYMVNYCPRCSTVLSDIELKEHHRKSPSYFIKFPFENGEASLILQTDRPEFLFSTTHVLIHPKDSAHSKHIGKKLINPSTGLPVLIVESKRKFDPQNPEPLKPFNPSFDKYDYGYTLRNEIPSKRLLDWDGRMVEHHPGLMPDEARIREVEKLKEQGAIDKIDDSHTESLYLCKKGHTTENIIIDTWFIRLNDKKNSLVKRAVETVKKDGLRIIPQWRESGLMEWINKMPDWPIARQNVWGIKIPVWYEITDPKKIRVWFIDKKEERHVGQLDSFLESGFSLEEISDGLERIHVEGKVKWSIQKEPGKQYLPETDTFDTWFSSGQWATNVYINSSHPQDKDYFYPSETIVIGQDLLRLSVARKIVLSSYLTNKTPFRVAYLHKLILGQDGQKMSKSLGNAVTLESFIEKYGADSTRMALVSYGNEKDDFVMEDERLASFRNFCNRLWKIGRVVELANKHEIAEMTESELSIKDNELLDEFKNLSKDIGRNIERYFFSDAQNELYNFLNNLENYTEYMKTRNDFTPQLSVLKHIFKTYLVILHPFAPFITEELYQNLYNSENLLANTSWPRSYK